MQLLHISSWSPQCADSSCISTALPPSRALPPPSPTPVLAKIHLEVQIDCPNQPGTLREYYYIEWRNGSSNDVQVLADIPPFGSNRDPIRRDARYRIDPVTFALTISNVTLLDMDIFYVCELGVVNPQDRGRIFTYDASADIGLLVYGKEGGRREGGGREGGGREGGREGGRREGGWEGGRRGWREGGEREGGWMKL